MRSLLFLFGFMVLPLLPLRAALTNFNLRVMAANTTSGNSQRYETAGLNIFKGLKPDVVAIQEFNVSNSFGINTTAALSNMVATTFGTSFVYFRESGYSIPNGVISRYPIVDSGSWDDVQVPDRGFAWAQIDLPGTNNLYVVSVHLHSGGGPSSRATESTNLANLISANFPAGAWIIVGGDFNIDTSTEDALDHFKTYLSDNPIPTDAISAGDPDTNEPRSERYDYLLPSFSLTNSLTNVVTASHSFPKGLVFDSAVYTPLSDVSPIASGDSHVTGMQHMAVVKDFRIVYATTNSGAPTITNQPQSLTVTQGNNATFTVGADGNTPLGYQWRFNGANIGVATTSSYTRNNAQPGDAGSYTVVVSNSVGMVTSAVAVLTVNVPPSITTPPQNQTVIVGSNATFTVTAGGTSPFGYQWRFNGANISAATLSSYTRSNAQSGDAGSYTVVVTNVAGGLTSSVATLTVNVPASITNQPQNQSVTVGSNATFTVGASGTLPLSYQWRFNGGNLSGETQSSYTRVNAQPGDAGSYTVVVTNVAGGATSSVATLTVNVPPSISVHPQNQTVNQRDNVTFSVTAAGTSLAYQWRFNMANISAATLSSYTKSNAQPEDIGSYTVLITNAAGSVTSSIATLSLVVAQPTLGIATNTIFWQGLSNLAYSVQAQRDLNSNWTALGTASSPTTTVLFTNVNDGTTQRFYRVVYP